MLGELVGSYRIVDHLGEGGMGVVYVAEHTLLGRRAAVKMLLPALSASREIVGRFFNEARAATLIRHPGIVDNFDFGYHASGRAFFIMELLSGESLASRIRKDRVLSVDVAVAITLQLASALAAAHLVGIVHRDLKPDNVYLVPDAAIPCGLRVKVLDFGIAKLVGDLTVSLKTQTGAMMGTPTYMSPEQCRGAQLVDHRSDVYAVGCVMYEMLSGRTPFIVDGDGEMIAAHLHEPPPPPTAVGAHIPAALEAIIVRTLAKRPEDRAQSMWALATEIHRAAAATLEADAAPRTANPRSTGSPAVRSAAGAAPHRRRRWWWLAALPAAVLAVRGLSSACSGSEGLPLREAVDAFLPATPSPAPSDGAAVAAAPDERPDDRPDDEQRREAWVAAKVTEVKTLVADGRCADARRRAGEIVARFADEKALTQRLLSPCRKPEPANLARRDGPRAEALLAEARAAYRDGNHAVALAAATEAAAVGGGEAALYLVAAAACKLRSVEQAAPAYRRLGASKQVVVRRLCAEVGIDLS